MPKFREDWYEDRVPFQTEEFFEEIPPVQPSFEMVQLDPRELEKSQQVGRAAWQRYRDEIEAQIKSVFDRPEEATLTELVAYMDFMKYGVLRYGYDDEHVLTDDEIGKMMEDQVIIKYNNPDSLYAFWLHSLRDFNS